MGQPRVQPAGQLEVHQAAGDGHEGPAQQAGGQLLLGEHLGRQYSRQGWVNSHAELRQATTAGQQAY